MELIKDTPFEFGYFAWQVAPGRESMVAAVKATFAIVPDGVCALADEQAPVSGEAFFDDDDEGSVRTDTDLAVHKPRGECFLAGTCYPPGGKPATVSAVAFRIGSVSKNMAVIGDRYWSRGRITTGLLTNPEPFTSMQLRYERSFGGPGFDRNPVGKGTVSVETPSGSRRPLPNLEDPRALITSPDARPDPMGAFPIPRTWKSRMAFTGTYDSRWFKTRWPYFPDDFDWRYFNAAPLDQQIDGYWRGDEEIQLQNLHPEHAMIRTRLPGLRARCFVEIRSAGGLEFREVALQLDTITVDADAMNVLCVWRGVTDVASDKLADVARAFVMHEPLAAPMTQADCRTRMERVAHAEEVEQSEFHPEDIPTEMHPAGAGASAIAAPPLPPPEDPAAEVKAQLAALGIDLDAEPPPPPPPTAEDIEKLKKALADAGQEVPPELDQILEPPPPPPPPAPKGTSQPRDLRTEVYTRHAAGESLEGMDLTGADLSELDLRGAKLSKAILDGVRFTRTRLDGATLDDAVLTRANLTRVVLAGASLKGADLTGAVGPQASFDDANLEGAILQDAAFARCAFRRTRLAKAEMLAIDLSGSVLEQAILDGADLSRARLEDCVFSGASLVEATLEAVSGPRANFDGCDLTKLRASGSAQLPEASFKNVKAAGSRWVGARLDEANFSLSILDRADFSNTSLVQATFNGCSIKSGKFVAAVLVGATILKSNVFEGLFEAADLSHADLRGSNFFGAEFWKAKTELIRTELANLKRTKLEGRM